MSYFSLKEASQRMKRATSEMTSAVVALQDCDGFESTIKEMKEQIGDMTVATQLIDAQLTELDKQRHPDATI
ncbi:hypothetical protein P7M17_01760 [Vibrio parahaemolyticus]|jgi:hypothetical protein|uniref:hypothetical protein n=2 Tax=Vibrionaceae TaxID=641 RepID=UPI000472A106|nr:hypothetical protein [Vibrio parahaemolyticus]MDG2754321.1 hypothetical protein [Vibrio parahaemolyticus]NYU23786.1 hypothetical protein [Vibrio parahaemolyticus]WKV20295.1 hypothetical protein [Vibrio parahaemolyticus]